MKEQKIREMSNFSYSQWIQMMTFFKERMDLARMYSISPDESLKEKLLKDINDLTEIIKKQSLLEKID
jgi:hypothetical protein